MDGKIVHNYINSIQIAINIFTVHISKNIINIQNKFCIEINCAHHVL